jgi:acyl-CoA thioester hydrolase
MSISWDYPAPFVQDIVATEADIDNLGHVNNTTYIRWCENLAWNHSAQLGLNADDCVELKRAMAIHHAEYDYLKACFPGDKLEAATWITACDFKLSMERRFQIVGNTGVVFRGCWQLICVNLASNKPVRIPQQFIDVYRGALISKP